MKSRSRLMLEKSVAAMLSAIEIYNKLDFKYREETFAVLCINAWELLLKAKLLNLANNKLTALYAMEGEFNLQVHHAECRQQQDTSSLQPRRIPARAPQDDA